MTDGTTARFQPLEETLRNELGLHGDDVTVDDGPDVFGTPFRVSHAAVHAAAGFVGAVAAHNRSVHGGTGRGRLDPVHVAASFSSERLVRATGIEPALWASMSGNYRADDGWLRIHANLTRHREAAQSVLGCAATRDATAAAVARWDREDVVAAIVGAGGVAAVARTEDEWRSHPHHQHLREQPLIAVARSPDAPGPPGSGGGEQRILGGIRVLDCTRVIAGPVAGRLLASFGADVMRIDSPLGDLEVLELDTGFGKRRRELDLTTDVDRTHFDELVRHADVVLDAFRPGVFAALGYDDEHLWRLRPGLVIGHLSAFGESGTWAGRRGFDSIVQVATGIAHGMGFDDQRGPAALPVQLLDHGTGHVLAAAVVRALTHRALHGHGTAARVSLVRFAEWFRSLGPGSNAMPLDITDIAEPYLRTIHTDAWGMVRHVLPTGTVDGHWPLPGRPSSRRHSTHVA